MTLVARLAALERSRPPAGRYWLEVFFCEQAVLDQAAAEWGVTRDELNARLDQIEAEVNRARAFFSRRGRWSAQVIRTALLAYVQPAFTFEDCEALLRALEDAGAPIRWDNALG